MVILQQISDEIVLSDSINANHGPVLTKSVGGNLNIAFSRFDFRWDSFGYVYILLLCLCQCFNIKMVLFVTVVTNLGWNDFA